MKSRCSYLEQELRSKREWLASRTPEQLEEFDSHRRTMTQIDIEDLLHMAQSDRSPFEAVFAEILGWRPELVALRKEITSISEHLEWIAKGRSARGRAR
jgi:hypothetical protein